MIKNSGLNLDSFPLNRKEIIMSELTVEQKSILTECLRLLDKYKELCDKEETTGTCMDEQTDEVYDRYWHLLHDNFSVDLLRTVESEIGHGKFIETDYINALIKVLINHPKIIYEYNGFELVSRKDYWGNQLYYTRCNGIKYSDVFDAVDDDWATSYFVSSIDDDPGSPNF